MALQPDKLFRDKLENFQRPATVAAWERIESGLEKNQSKGVWLKFAAGLALFATATFLLWPADHVENQQASNTNIVIPKPEPVQENTSEKTLPAIAKEEPTSQKAITKNKAATREPVLVAETTTSTIESDIVPAVEITEPQVAVAETNTIETTPSNTIVYTADEVNARFLKKKSPPEATATEKKTSGMQKLMGLAYTIKNPENGLGDLRQKKDEILALNFLSTEDKTNKEKN